MDRFKLMRTFVSVVNAGSLTAAASQLGLSRAVVSRHLGELEAHLGVRLVNRTTRALALTDLGGSYWDFCHRVLAEIEEQEAALGRTQEMPSGPLKVVAPKSFGSAYLGDAVIGFSMAYPRLQVSLTLDDYSFRPSDFLEAGLDLAIRLSHVRDAAIMSRRLASLRWLLVAAPDYLKRRGAPTAPADLARHNCLVHVNLDSSDRVWRFDGPEGAKTVKVAGPFLSNSALVLRKAVLGGMGVGILPRYLIHEDIDRGDLIELLPDFHIPDRPLFALYPHADLVPRKVRLFTDYLKNWFDARSIAM